MVTKRDGHREERVLCVVLAIVCLPAVIAAVHRGDVFDADAVICLVLLAFAVYVLFDGAVRSRRRTPVAAARARRRAR